MKRALLIVTLILLAPLSACTDDMAVPPDESGQTSANTATDETKYHLVNGLKVRLAEDGERGISSDANRTITFRRMASFFSKQKNVSEQEVLHLNGWTDVADEKIPNGVKFWIHPSLR